MLPAAVAAVLAIAAHIGRYRCHCRSSIAAAAAAAAAEAEAEAEARAAEAAAAAAAAASAAAMVALGSLGGPLQRLCCGPFEWPWWERLAMRPIASTPMATGAREMRIR